MRKLWTGKNARQEIVFGVFLVLFGFVEHLFLSQLHQLLFGDKFVEVALFCFFDIVFNCSSGINFLEIYYPGADLIVFGVVNEFARTRSLLGKVLEIRVGHFLGMIQGPGPTIALWSCGIRIGSLLPPNLQ